jgi:hypothetical protein
MSVMWGILANTLIIAGMIVWLSRGGGDQWINTLNATSLSTCISLFVIMETAGAVLGIYIWAHVTGHTDPLDKSLGYLGIWFGFLGTHLLANAGTQIAKRTTDGSSLEKQGAAKPAVEAAKATGAASGAAAALVIADKAAEIKTREHAAPPAPVVVNA